MLSRRFPRKIGICVGVFLFLSSGIGDSPFSLRGLFCCWCDQLRIRIPSNCEWSKMLTTEEFPVQSGQTNKSRTGLGARGGGIPLNHRSTSFPQHPAGQGTIGKRLWRHYLAISMLWPSYRLCRNSTRIFAYYLFTFSSKLYGVFFWNA